MSCSSSFALDGALATEVRILGIVRDGSSLTLVRVPEQRRKVAEEGHEGGVKHNAPPHPS